MAIKPHQYGLIVGFFFTASLAMIARSRSSRPNGVESGLMAGKFSPMGLRFYEWRMLTFFRSSICTQVWNRQNDRTYGQNCSSPLSATGTSVEKGLSLLLRGRSYRRTYPYPSPDCRCVPASSRCVDGGALSCWCANEQTTKPDQDCRDGSPLTCGYRTRNRNRCDKTL